MAATNYTPIQLYYSTTASAAPTAGNLVNGELAINITDGKLYYKDNGGVVQVIATKGAGTIGGSNTQIQFNDGGALAGNAAMVFNKATNVTTLTTLNLTNALGAAYGGTAQSAYAQGDLLYASAVNTLSKLSIGTVNYILTSTGSVPQWVAPTSVTVQTANNLAGGAAGSVPYQSAADTTTFLSIGAANRVMTSTGSAPQWVTSLTGLTGVSSSSMTNTSLTSGRVVYSGASGVQTDSSNLTFNGTTLSAGGFSTTGNSTLVKLVTIGDSSFTTGAVLAAATPAKLYIGTGAVTDGSSAGGATNTLGTITAFGQTQVIATNANVTYTNLATLYIAGAPTAGTNVTITNPYALYVAGGDAYFGGTVTAGTVNLTTLDLTNLEVTNIKAKDGTASITLADSTGVASFSANPILSGGTANGVAYLNGSKVLTTGSALTFDGTKLLASAGASTTGEFKTTSSTAQVFSLVASNDAGTSIGLGVFGSAAGTFGTLTAGNPFLSTAADRMVQNVQNASGAFIWGIGSTPAEQMRLNTTGLGLGTNTPQTKVHLVGTTELRLNTTASGAVIQFWKDAAATAASSIGNAIPGGSVTNDLLFATYTGSSWLEQMRLTSTGLGIGVSSPSQKLAVAGNISVGATGNNGIQFHSGSPTGSNLEWWVSNNQGASNELNFYYYSGGVFAGNAMSITKTGNVGIGTSSPSTNLEVSGGSAVARISGTSGTVPQLSLSSAGVVNWTLRSNNDGGSDFTIYQDATQRLKIDSNGYVGIRTSSPAGFLHVAPGSAAAASTAGAPIILQAQTGGSNASGGNILIGSGQNGSGGSNGYIAFGIGSSTSGSAFATGEAMRITSTGNLLVDNAGPVSDANLKVQLNVTSSNTQRFFAVNNNGGYGLIMGFLYNDQANIRTVGAYPLVLGTNNGERLRITSAGYVGIGTSNPGTTLDVAAAYNPGIRVQQNYTFSGANYALSVSGDGATAGYLSQNPAAGGMVVADGMRYYGGGPWTPDSTSAESMQMLGGNIIFTSNTGLTGGVNFTPTERARLTAAGDWKVTGQVVLASEITVQSFNKSLTGGGATETVFTIAIGDIYGDGIYKFTVFAVDATYPNGNWIQEIYVTGSREGLGVVNTAITQQDKVLGNNGIAYPTWSISVSGNSYLVRATYSYGAASMYIKAEWSASVNNNTTIT